MDQPCEYRLISVYERPQIPSDLLPDQTPGILSLLQAYRLRAGPDSPLQIGIAPGASERE